MSDLEETSESQPILPQTSNSQVSIFLFLLEVVILLTSIAVVIWLILAPKSPIYIITNVHIPALHGRNSTSHVYVSSVAMNSTLNHTRDPSILLDLIFSNPNKRVGIYYKDIYITLFHCDAHIGSKLLPGFYQGYKNATTYEVLVEANKQFWKEITNGTIDLRVCVENAVKYKIFVSKTKHYQIYTEAYVPVGSNGRMLGKKNIKLHHISNQIKN
ncbi:protein NDR1-like [Quercus lobata]|uniref:Late embryogenesis abundant protein LEA-2 subgroup domain-containing protein n=1 Tax=Quercus lobata TaxID=97700 RepID=A0A7N2LSQ1_QUELO|nr:protein NDR1-like [Quercus lobata]